MAIYRADARSYAPLGSLCYWFARKSRALPDLALEFVNLQDKEAFLIPTPPPSSYSFDFGTKLLKKGKDSAAKPAAKPAAAKPAPKVGSSRCADVRSSSDSRASHDPHAGGP